ncbi:MAG: hypothetical protein JO316_21005 [Abitibacteriaceae bacterium]|nr:hypothetical protein [Abditibacteriaceae bacterium]
MIKWTCRQSEMLFAPEDMAANVPSNSSTQAATDRDKTGSDGMGDGAVGVSGDNHGSQRSIPRSAADSGTGPDDKDLADVGPTVGPGTDIPLPDDMDISPTSSDGRTSGTVGGPVGGMGT